MDLQPVRDAYSAMSARYIARFDGDWQPHEDDTRLIRGHLTGRPGPLLDVGCGPGYWTAYLHSQGVDVTGIDLVPEFIAHARAAHPGPPFRLGSMTEVPAAAHSVAGILTWYSTIHLPPAERLRPAPDDGRVHRGGTPPAAVPAAPGPPVRRNRGPRILTSASPDLPGPARDGENARMVVQRYRATVIDVGRGRVVVPVPFDPDQVFGRKVRHHVAGTVDGMGVRAVIEAIDGGYGFVLGVAWRRDCGVSPGDVVEVSVAPEGPQRDDLPADLAAALQSNPAAGEFFDSLAQFYRKGYLRWIDATRRNPERRAERIAETVRLLAEGHRSRPTP